MVDLCFVWSKYRWYNLAINCIVLRPMLTFIFVTVISRLMLAKLKTQYSYLHSNAIQKKLID